MNKQISVLIPDGESNHALIVARCLAQVPDLKVHVLSEVPWAPLRFSRRRSSYQVKPRETNRDQYLTVIRNAIKKTKADIILPVDEKAILLASSFSEDLAAIASTVPIPSIETFQMATDKWMLAEFMNRKQIPTPETILYTADETFDQHLDDLHFPVLAKPARGDGGKGIASFNNQTSLKQWLKYAVNGKNFQYIVQSFIQGYDVDCSVLCKNGKILAYTTQKGIIKRSNEFAAPGGIEFLVDKQVLNMVTRLLAELNWSGVAHIDLRYDTKTNQLKIIELNSRYWGSLTGSLLAGVNFPYLSCLAGMNITFPLPDYSINRYVDHLVFATKTIKGMMKGASFNFKINESDLKYVFQDPVAEFLNIIRRRFGTR
jgi:predicted ATP-grasp superfamily ATP-dependent carboligase